MTLMAFTLFTGSVRAESDATEAENARRALDIARTTMSPFCPGRTLDGCSSPPAGEWRADIREMVDQGLSAQEIQKRLQARAPDKDLTGDPDFGLGVGFALTAFVVALGLLALVLKRLSTPAEAPSGGSTRPMTSSKKDDDEELERRLEAELRDTE
jgi:cytochrome c-type biogenesis protein CcmH/NrfF